MEPNETPEGDAEKTSNRAEDVRLSAVREELAVGVRKVETGAVRVRKLVHEELQPVSVRLHSERVEVTRVAVNRPVEERSEPRREGDTLIIPVYDRRTFFGGAGVFCNVCRHRRNQCQAPRIALCGAAHIPATKLQ
jgi:stress response protein YsnF